MDVCGIATDHCVRPGADAVAAFPTRAAGRAVRRVAPETTRAAFEAMLAAGGDRCLTCSRRRPTGPDPSPINRPASFRDDRRDVGRGFASAMESRYCRSRRRPRGRVTGAGDAATPAPASPARTRTSFDVCALDRANRMVRAVVSCLVPVVAAVNGDRGGRGLLDRTGRGPDGRVVVRTSFLLAFARVGLMPDGGAIALVVASKLARPRYADGPAHEPLSAADALAAGLVADVVEPDSFDALGRAPARRLASGPPLASAYEEGDQRRDALVSPRGRLLELFTGQTVPAPHRRRRRGRVFSERHARPVFRGE